MRIEYRYLKVYNYVTEEETVYNGVYNVTQKDKMIQFTMPRGLISPHAIIRVSPAIITSSEHTLKHHMFQAEEIKDEN